MDAIECIRTRRSIRAFKSDPVPDETLKNIFDAALRSPSYKNSQPWQVVVVSGKKRDDLAKLLAGLLEAGAPPTPDMPAASTWPPNIDARIKEHLRRRAAQLGQDIKDKETWKKGKAANFNLYGAPHAAFIHQDSTLTDWSILDAGLYCQTLMLAATAHGVATVPQAYLAEYAAETKEFLAIPKSHRLLLGISIGYADENHPANSYKSQRATIDEIVRWER